MAETSRAFQEMLGYSGEELSKLRFLEIVHPDDVEETEAQPPLPSSPTPHR